MDESKSEQDPLQPKVTQEEESKFPPYPVTAANPTPYDTRPVAFAQQPALDAYKKRHDAVSRRSFLQRAAAWTLGALGLGVTATVAGNAVATGLAREEAGDQVRNASIPKPTATAQLAEDEAAKLVVEKDRLARENSLTIKTGDPNTLSRPKMDTEDKPLVNAQFSSPVSSPITPETTK